MVTPAVFFCILGTACAMFGSEYDDIFREIDAIVGKSKHSTHESTTIVNGVGVTTKTVTENGVTTTTREFIKNGKVFSDSNINAIIEKAKAQGSLTSDQADYILSNDFATLPKDLQDVSKNIGLPENLRDIAKTLGMEPKKPGLWTCIRDCCTRWTRRCKCCVGCLTCTGYCLTCCCLCDGCGKLPKAREVFFNMPLATFLKCFSGEVMDKIEAANPMGPDGIEMLKGIKELQQVQPSDLRRRLQSLRVLDALKPQL